MLSYLREKYNEFQSLQELVATQEKSRTKVFFRSCGMVFTMYYNMFVQYAFSNVKHIDSKNSVISYVVNGREYKLKLQIKKGPNPINSITDENGSDITLDILPYLGPKYDFHLQKYTPRDFEKKSLVIKLSNDTVYTFNENDLIVLDIQ